MIEFPNFAKLKSWFESEAFSSGARAELRRISVPEDTALTPTLYRLFPGEKPDARHRRFAFFLPYGKHQPGAKSLASQLVENKISETRLLQIARSKDPIDLIQLRRLLTQIDPILDWSAFGRMIWCWSESSKRQIVEDFYLAQFKPLQGEKPHGE